MIEIGVCIDKKIKKDKNINYGVPDFVSLWEGGEILYNLTELKRKLIKLKTQDSLSPKEISFLEIVKRNKVLAETISQFRKTFSIASLTYANYYSNPWDEDITFSPNIKISEKEQCFIDRIRQEYQIHPYVRAILANLLFSGIISSSSKISTANLTFTPIARVGLEETIAIHILSSKVKKNTIISYIEKNWARLKKEIDKLPTNDIPTLSDRDLKIYDLKEEGKSYSRIADIIPSLFPGNDANYDAATIKTAYQRAKKSISAVFEKKRKIA